MSGDKSGGEPRKKIATGLFLNKILEVIPPVEAEELFHVIEKMDRKEREEFFRLEGRCNEAAMEFLEKLFGCVSSGTAGELSRLSADASACIFALGYAAGGLVGIERARVAFNRGVAEKFSTNFDWPN